MVCEKEKKKKTSLFPSLSCFSGGANAKKLTCQCRRSKRLVLYPWVRRYPGGVQWQPTSVFLPGEPHRQRSLVGYGPWGCQKSDMMEQVTRTLLWVVPLGPWGHLLPRPSHRCSAQQTVGVGAGADVAADVEGPVTLVREMEGPATSPVEHSKVGHCSGMYPGGGAARLIHPALVACPAPTRKGGREVRVDPGGV